MGLDEITQQERLDAPKNWSLIIQLNKISRVNLNSEYTSY